MKGALLFALLSSGLSLLCFVIECIVPLPIYNGEGMLVIYVYAYCILLEPILFPLLFPMFRLVTSRKWAFTFFYFLLTGVILNIPFFVDDHHIYSYVILKSLVVDHRLELWNVFELMNPLLGFAGAVGLFYKKRWWVYA